MPVPIRAVFALSMLVAAFLGLGSGCGGTDEDATPRPSRCSASFTFDRYTPGLTKRDGEVAVSLRAAVPAPPDRGQNRWTLAVTKAGKPLAGATVTIKPWMPEHGHGTTPPTFTAKETTPAGTYTVGPFDLFMPGVWRVTVRVDQGGKRLASVDFLFCAEG